MKKTNYTKEQTEALLKAYVEDNNSAFESVAVIAQELGRTKESVRSKLVAEGVYQKQVVANKNGVAVVRKDALVKELNTVLKTDIDEIASLAKGTKTALEAVLKAVKELTTAS